LVKKPVVKTSIPLSALDRDALKAFVDFSIGDPHLTAYEENFVNSMKQRLLNRTIFVSIKQAKIITQIKEKLHYNQPNVPLPPIDPDGIEPNNDPDGLSIDADGYPINREVIDQFDIDDASY
jgi:hypothetical protein